MCRPPWTERPVPLLEREGVLRDDNDFVVFNKPSGTSTTRHSLAMIVLVSLARSLVS
jgi:hypothetical protein